MLTALTFGLCSLVGARADTQYTCYIVYALIACILVVLPNVELSAEDDMSPVISEAQRAVLLHSIAMVVLRGLLKFCSFNLLPLRNCVYESSFSFNKNSVANVSSMSFFMKTFVHV
jgi:hypothetical protein